MRLVKTLLPFLVIVALVAGAYYISVSSKKADQNRETLKISTNFQDLIDAGILIDMAEDEGYLRKAGIRVEKVESKNNAESLIAGTSDASVSPVPSMIDGFYNGVDFKWLATTNNYMLNYAVSRLSEDKISEVKNVGIMKMGNSEQTIWPQILAKYGHKDTANVKYVAAPEVPTKVALLDKGEIDIFFVQNLTTAMDLKSTGKYTILDPEEIMTEEIDLPRGIMTLKKNIESKGKQIEGFVDAMYKAIGYLEDHKSEFVERAQRDYKMSQENAELLFTQVMTSRKNLQFVPAESRIDDISRFVLANNKPKQPNRNLNDFFFKDYAEKIVK
jgi:ABC-type nitrate/sulfonate/bicarbonate transport system substrate-binding protein